MVEIALIRHGPTEWNEQRRLQGQSDIPLSAKGRERVKNWKIPKEFIKSKRMQTSGKAGLFAGSLELSKEGNIELKQNKLFDKLFIREKQ